MASEIALESVSQKVFGFSSRRYRQLASEGHVPEVVAGKIDFVASAKAVIEYYRKLAEGSGSITLVDERQQLVKVQRQLKELELLVKQGEIIPRETILQEFLARIYAVKGGLLSLHRSLPPQLAGKDARDMAGVIKKQCRQLLDKFSRKGGVLKK